MSDYDAFVKMVLEDPQNQEYWARSQNEIDVEELLATLLSESSSGEAYAAKGDSMARDGYDPRVGYEPSGFGQSISYYDSDKQMRNLGDPDVARMDAHRAILESLGYDRSTAIRIADSENGLAEVLRARAIADKEKGTALVGEEIDLKRTANKQDYELNKELQEVKKILGLVEANRANAESTEKVKGMKLTNAATAKQQEEETQLNTDTKFFRDLRAGNLYKIPTKGLSQKEDFEIFADTIGREGLIPALYSLISGGSPTQQMQRRGKQVDRSQLTSMFKGYDIKEPLFEDLIREFIITGDTSVLNAFVNRGRR
jgi:hypothetical protein